MVPSSFHPERWCGYREFSGCFRVTQQEIGPSTTWSKHEYRWRMRRISELTSGDFSKLQKISVWRIFRSAGPLLEVRLAENSEADDAHRSPARPDKMYRQAFPKRIVQIPGMVVLFFERTVPVPRASVRRSSFDNQTAEEPRSTLLRFRRACYRLE